MLWMLLARISHALDTLDGATGRSIERWSLSELWFFSPIVPRVCQSIVTFANSSSQSSESGESSVEKMDSYSGGGETSKSSESSRRE